MCPMRRTRRCRRQQQGPTVPPSHPRVLHTCAVCAFFQEEGDRGIGFALPPNFDPEGLRRPHIQRQFVRVLEAGGSELAMQEIDWTEVIEKWKVCPPESMSH
jgi:hypothetical protein